MCKSVCMDNCANCCKCCIMFENRHGKRSQGNNDHTYYHVEAKGHLDIFERPEELRLRLDVLKQSEERMEESIKKQLGEELKKQQGILSLLDFFNSVKQQDDHDDNISKLDGFIPMGTISMETVDN